VLVNGSDAYSYWHSGLRSKIEPLGSHIRKNEKSPGKLSLAEARVMVF
jgi:hypothetical protein